MCSIPHYLLYDCFLYSTLFNVITKCSPVKPNVKTIDGADMQQVAFHPSVCSSRQAQRIHPEQTPGPPVTTYWTLHVGLSLFICTKGLRFFQKKPGKLNFETSCKVETYTGRFLLEKPDESLNWLFFFGTKQFACQRVGK